MLPAWYALLQRLAPRLRLRGESFARRRARRLAGYLLWLGALLVSSQLILSSSAEAHPFSVSSMSVDIGQEQLDVLLDLDIPTLLDVRPIDLDRDRRLSPAELRAAEPELINYLKENVGVENGGEACAKQSTRFEHPKPERLWVRQSYRCASPLGRLKITNRLLMEDPGGHRIAGQFLLGTTPVHHVFLLDKPEFELNAAAAPKYPSGYSHSQKSLQKPAQENVNSNMELSQTSLLSWVREGIVHILLGFDHVLFVIGLIVVVMRFKELIWVVSAFTIAHSVTLVLGATGLVQVNSRLVESLIAASIVYIAVDNFRAYRLSLKPASSPAPPERSGVIQRMSDAAPAGQSNSASSSTPLPGAHEPQRPQRYWLPFAFGLVHGFGFAGVLGGLGLPTEGRAVALLGFNIGVELGQLALVLPLFPLVKWLQSQPKRHAGLIYSTSLGLGLIGSLWLIDRVLDLGWMPF